MAIVIPFRRPRPVKARGERKTPAANHSAEQFWRKSMVPVSIAMGAVIVLALAALVVGAKTGLLGHNARMWVLVAATVSVIGLTKIVVANMFFYLLTQDDARLDEPPPVLAARTVAKPRPRRRTLRPVPSRPPNQPEFASRMATLPLE